MGDGHGAGDAWQAATGGSLVRALRRWAVERSEHVALRFLERGERVADAATYAELDRDARRVAAGLRGAAAVGRPVLVALPPGLDFVRCLVGCLYAGAIPVPTPAWDDPRAAGRIAAILAQARPALVIAREGLGEGTRDSLRGWAGPVIPPQELLRGDGDTVLYDPAPGEIALLQYTSGSTSRPRGVVVTHGNLAANLEMIRLAFALEPEETTVSWLPLHHDMGLIGGVLEMLHLGASVVLMSPLAFVQRPARWLRAISTFGAVSGGPNFGYELCARMVSDTQLAGVDLSRWRLAFCGAEPVRPATLARFAGRFAVAGFDAKSFYPCYGLAEATLFVTGGRAGEGALVEAGESVSCGFPRAGCEVALLERDAPFRAAAGGVGEIGIAGPNVSPGFWDPDHGVVADAERMAVVEGRRFLRTGDLGRMVGDALHVAGRVRNMIVVHGANIHAEDVERTVLELPATEGLGPEGLGPEGLGPEGLGAVVAVPVVEGGAEGFLVVCEIRRGETVPPGLAAAVAAAVGEAHGVVPQEVVLVAAGGVLRTVSGKLQREATGAAYRAGRLVVLARHGAARAPG